MIPYFEQPVLGLGPLSIHAFGVLAAIGLLVGVKLATIAARNAGLDVNVLSRALTAAVIGGVVGGHLMHVLAYQPQSLLAEGPLVLLKLWDGQSSMGGVLGGATGLLVSFHRQRIAVRPYLDSIALGLAPGWAIARLGCFAAHDHPGALTSFPLAVAFPGGARHDLGLYDALVLGALAIVLYGLRRKADMANRLIAVLAIGYAVPRFFLDFLRASDLATADARYFGLTPAQYVAIGLVIAGLALWRRSVDAGARPMFSIDIMRLAQLSALILAATAIAIACTEEVKETPAPVTPAAPATSAMPAMPVAQPPPAVATGAKVAPVADRNLVCMVNDQFMGKPQIPIEVEGRTYYGCCEMCKQRLGNDAKARAAVDPVSGKSVDKATAEIGVKPTGDVLYFETKDNLDAFNRS